MDTEWSVWADLAFARTALRDSQRRSRSTEEHFDLVAPITHDGRTLGVVVGESDFEVAADKVDAVIPQIIAASLIVALLGGLLVWLIARYFARPVRDLALAGLRIAPTIPGQWKGFTAVRVFRGTTYRIAVERAGPGNSAAITVITRRPVCAPAPPAQPRVRGWSAGSAAL